ncbi:XdhC family protein [Flavisolibacter ginsenosidimutans]|uniref:XdhC family protein n=1 Tax=Flavisolibacter ginsenosidimutans TaxID=661481 RepID=A0A5B8UMV3_9BACT|nr:XdhC/CoxI family protein [Flavisolibacter ginsenosidimutans]QEC58011.1 XdhC family protein [Flavisolibacter ginsenosidimutans]
MKKKLAVWQLIRDSLDANVPVTLLYVLESNGSSPGRQGFFMAVTAVGSMQGSIGGGMMEQKLVEKARANMQLGTSNRQEGELIKQVHDKAAAKNQSGMICSGEQKVWMYRVQQKDKEAISQVISCLENFENATLQINRAGIFFQRSTSAKTFFNFHNEEDWLYEEMLGYQNHLYIIGGGHCSLALSNLVSTLDFYIHLLDNRSNLLTVEQNETAHEKILLDDYSELSPLIQSGNNNYVVVMTFGYRTDDIVVRALLDKQFKYFGLLGSKAKIQNMFETYRSEGIDEKFLQSIHAPVGLQIKSETPEEIAVSIAAELIKVKNAPPQHNA